MEQMTHNGVTLAFEDAGKGAPPILLIHHLGCDRTSRRAQLEHFRRHHRVVAVDLPEHPRLTQAPRECVPADLAGELAWLCYELGVYRPVVVGHGVGGLIAVELAVRFPDLLGAVVIQDTPPLADVLAQFRVPILHIQTGTISIDADRLRELSPHVTVKSVRLGCLRPGEAMAQVNAVVDAFLISLQA